MTRRVAHHRVVRAAREGHNARRGGRFEGIEEEVGEEGAGEEVPLALVAARASVCVFVKRGEKGC